MSTDTTPADNQQLFALIAALEHAQQTAAEQGITVYDLKHRGPDIAAEQAAPQWAVPDHPLPADATTEAERLDNQAAHDDWADRIYDGYYPEEQLEA